MPVRWRGRFAGLAIAPLLSAVVLGPGFPAPEAAVRAIRLERPDGTVIASVPVEGAAFTLRYRNSLYGSVAEERFHVIGEGFRLAGLAADELAVLEEYYVIAEPAARSSVGLGWSARPADPLELSELRVAATNLGRRTLLVEGEPPVELWRLVEDADPTVVIRVVAP